MTKKENMTLTNFKEWYHLLITANLRSSAGFSKNTDTEEYIQDQMMYEVNRVINEKGLLYQFLWTEDPDFIVRKGKETGMHKCTIYNHLNKELAVVTEHLLKFEKALYEEEGVEY